MLQSTGNGLNAAMKQLQATKNYFVKYWSEESF